MPSTYTVNLGIEKPATGEQSGTWGDTTNVNFDIIDQAINGVLSLTLASAGTSGSPNVLSIDNGATSDGRNKWIEFVDGGDLGANAYVQLDPNDAEKIVFFRNSLSGSRSVFVFQGTYNAANDFEIPAGYDVVLKFDGGGASATVTDVFIKLRVTELMTPTLTATTADINGGSIDGATVGAASASTGAFTTLTASTSLNIASSTTVDGVLDEDNMASNSATKLATQQSIKAYVDSQVGTVDTWAEVLANGATSGSTSPEIISGQALKTNTINETTAGSGVTIDSVLLKDDSVNAATLEVTTLKANDGTAAGSIANSTGVVTLTSVDINGGNIDGTTIGATSTANGNFSTVNASDVETSVISAKDGTTAINIADSTGAVDIDTSLNVDGTITADGLTVDSSSATFSGNNVYVSIEDTSAGGTAGIKFKKSTGDEVARIASSDSAALTLYTTSSTTAVFQVTGTGDIKFFDTSGNTSFLYDESAGVVFNEQSADRDFRVESNSNTNMLFVDGGTNRVGVGTGSPTEDLEVSGTNPTVKVTATSDNWAAFDNQAGDTQANYIFFRDSAAERARISVLNNETLAISTGSTPVSRMEIGSAETVFNQSGEDLDFRVESAGSANMLFVNAGANRVGINNGSPSYTLDVSGNIHASSTLILGDSVSAPGTLSINDNSATAYTLNFKGVGTRQYYMEGSSSGGIYDLTMQNASVADGFRLTVNGPAVFNENGDDWDFRVESDNQTHMLFVDASTDRVGVNTNTLVETFNVNGNIYQPEDGWIGNASDNNLLWRSDNLGVTGNSMAIRSLNDIVIATKTNAAGTGNVYIGSETTDPATAGWQENFQFRETGEMRMSEKACTAYTATTTSSTTTVTVFEQAIAVCIGAEVTILVNDTTATERYITKLLITHDGSTAVATEYGQVATDTALATFDVDISSGDLRVRATPASSNSMTFNVTANWTRP